MSGSFREFLFYLILLIILKTQIRSDIFKKAKQLKIWLRYFTLIYYIYYSVGLIRWKKPELVI